MILLDNEIDRLMGIEIDELKHKHKPKSKAKKEHKIDKSLENLIESGDRTKLITKVLELNDQIDGFRDKFLKLVGEMGKTIIQHGVKVELFDLSKKYQVKAAPSKSEIVNLQNKYKELEKKRDELKQEYNSVSSSRAKVLDALSKNMPKEKLDILTQIQALNTSIHKGRSAVEKLTKQDYCRRTEVMRAEVRLEYEKTDDVIAELKEATSAAENQKKLINTADEIYESALKQRNGLMKNL